jgi:mono/diheme cytochrome c family protein
MRDRDEARGELRRRTLSRQSLRSAGIAGFLVLTAISSVIAPAGTPIAAQEREALVARGKALFMEKGCHGCHTVGKVGFEPVFESRSRFRQRIQ